MRRDKPGAMVRLKFDGDGHVGSRKMGASKGTSPMASGVWHPFARPGGNGEGAPPDPIPNSAVKPLSADGTAS